MNTKECDDSNWVGLGFVLAIAVGFIWGVFAGRAMQDNKTKEGINNDLVDLGRAEWGVDPKTRDTYLIDPETREKFWKDKE